MHTDGRYRSLPTTLNADFCAAGWRNWRTCAIRGAKEFKQEFSETGEIHSLDNIVYEKMALSPAIILKGKSFVGQGFHELCTSTCLPFAGSRA